MKRKRLFIVILVLMVMAIVILTIVHYNNINKVESFVLSDYEQIISDFPSNQVLGAIADNKKAKQMAEEVWEEIYGDEVKKEKPYKVFFDSVEEVWLVKSSLKPHMVGGTAGILIQKSDGKVLAVWHEK